MIYATFHADTESGELHPKIRMRDIEPSTVIASQRISPSEISQLPSCESYLIDLAGLGDLWQISGKSPETRHIPDYA